MRLVLVSAICLILLLPALGHAALVTEQEARSIGENFIDYMVDVRGGWGDAKGAQVTDVKELWRDGLFLGYHLSVSPNGHIVVPAVRMLSPVKSFSFTEDFNTDAEAGYWQLLKDAMEYTLSAIEERHGPFHLLQSGLEPRKVARQWDWLLGTGMAPASIDTVGPLIKTHWEQGTPYNDNCPMGDGGTCVVGCVATAGCQTMRYWRHPSHGTGSHSYWWNGDQSCGGTTGGRTLSADFDHSYDWWNMRRRYILGYDSTEAAAVAALCSDVGIAWEMDYGHCGSGAYTARGLTVYPTWFKYLDTVTRHNRDEYPSAEAWFTRIREEFDADPPRPIHYRISGHSINCDGYIDAGSKYIHINYGWGGSSDGWYAVDSLYCPWTGCDPMVEYMLCGIEPGADFMDVTSGALADGGSTYGASWADYDGDGDPDLYITNGGSANRLLQNDGGGVFSDVTSPPLGDAGNGRSAVWGDYDDDGDLDLYLCNTSGANKLFRNDGGTFVDVTSGPLGDTGDSEGAVWADCDFDGEIDLYIVNNGSANRLLRYMGSDVFMDITSGPLGDAGSGYCAACGDYDNDGDPDIYLVNDGANRLFRNDGLGVFADATSGPLGDAASGRGAAWGDYDNDGDMDLYIANRGSANRLLRNDGAGAFVDVTAGPLGNTGNGMGASWIDCDSDGDLDIYLVNDGSENKIFRNRGDGTFQDATVVPLGDTGGGAAVACADYDGDGLTDIYVCDPDGSNLLFHNAYQPKRSWLRVKLVGTTSNAAGIGARVRIVAGGLSQIREISAGSGYCAHNSLIAEFGLADSVVVDTLEVVWPTAVVWDTAMVDPEQVVIATEPDISGIRETAGRSAGFALFPCNPNPFSASTLIRYALAERSKVRLQIYDVSGRVIKHLVESHGTQPGNHSVRWDSRNDDGQPVASGIYFYRLEAGRFTQTRRLVLLR